MTITVKSEQEGLRIDIFLMSLLPEISRATVKKAILNGAVKINEIVVKPNYKIKLSDNIFLDKEKFNSIANTDESSTLKAVKMPIEVIYEDENTLVINKPWNINVHPVLAKDNNSILNGVIYYLKQNNPAGTFRARLVHRLDKETSGVLLIAKNLKANDFYSEQFVNRQVQKTYHAIVHGDFLAFLETNTKKSWLIQTYIAKDENSNPKRFINTNSEKGKAAISEIFFEKYFNKFGKKKFSYVRILPKTGRTHQIRVHLSSLGFPILGDTLYDGQKYKRLLLHAYSLRFRLYGTNKEMTVVAQPPEKFKQ